MKFTERVCLIEEVEMSDGINLEVKIYINEEIELIFGKFFVAAGDFDYLRKDGQVLNSTGELINELNSGWFDTLADVCEAIDKRKKILKKENHE